MPRTAIKTKPGSARRAEFPAPPGSRRHVERGILENFIAFHLRQAQDAAFRAFVRLSGQKDFKPGRFAILMLLHYNPGMTQSELCREIARDKSTVTPLIQDLQRLGLIDRRRSPFDRRRVTVTLTVAGEKALSELLHHVREHDRRLDKIVGAAKPELLRLLKEITAALS